MSMSFGLNQQQVLKLKQLLSPKMIQMMKTFQHSYVDLVREVEEESKDNVFIEIKQYDQLSTYSQGKLGAESQDISEYAKSNESQSLESYMFEQLDMIHLSPKEDRIARQLIEQLDERGFISNYYEIREKIVAQNGVKERKVGDVLKILQSFEPDGVAARSLKECLLIQLQQQYFEHERLRDILETVIKEHLDDVANNNEERIAKACDIEIEGVAGVVAYIRENMNPNPGAGFSSSHFNQHIVPSFEAEIQDGELVIRNLEESMGIKINISDKYQAMLQDKSLDADSRQFLTEKYEKAKTLMENIERRHENLNKLARYILNHQVAFVKRGDLYLEPLLQKDIAEEIGVSASTISRICSSKYVRTPHGVVSFKQLCPRGYLGKTSERLNRMVKHLIDSQPGLSDQAYSNLLKEEGITLARRTITKYRHKAE